MMSSLFSLSSDERTNGKRDKTPSRKAFIKVFFERGTRSLLYNIERLSLSCA